MMCVNVYVINFKYEMRMKELNITGLFMERIAYTVSPTHDQVEGDVKDTIYQNVGIAFLRFPIRLGTTVL
jgi:hypothetical protein